ncbi:MAG: hypothetical protein V3S94_06755, partial [Gammaproteobacteria bacterium]
TRRPEERPKYASQPSTSKNRKSAMRTLAIVRRLHDNLKTIKDLAALPFCTAVVGDQIMSTQSDQLTPDRLSMTVVNERYD